MRPPSPIPILAGLLATLLGACRSTAPRGPAPLDAPPGLEVELTLRPGSPLGASARTADAPPWLVEFEVLGLESDADLAGTTPLAEHMRLVTAEGLARAVQPAPFATAHAGLARGEGAQRLRAELGTAGARRVVELFAADARVGAGTHLELGLSSPDPPPSTPRPPGGVRDRGTAPMPEPQPGPRRARASLLVGTEGEHLRVGLRLPSAGAPRLPELGEGASRERPTPLGHDEVVLLDVPLVEGEDGLVLVLPGLLPWGEAKALVVALRARPAEADPAGEREPRPRVGAQAGDPAGAHLAALLAALGDAQDPRAGLVHLAAELGAPALLDLSLAARPQHLAPLARAVIEAAAEVPDSERAALAWALERAALRSLVERRQGDGDDPAAAALLFARAGEAGAFPALLAEVLATRADLSAFEAWLREENRIFLSDRSPAARVRAYDWLASRGAAPPDFDPLGPEDARREALARFDAQEER